MEPHLQKIKLLLALSKSPNENEASNAAAMALKLIEKFGVTDAQLQEIEASDKPIYTDDDLLLETPTLADWKNILALVVAKKYDCYAIMEESLSSTGEQSFKYFVYGEPSDVIIAKQLFNYVYGEIDKLIESVCKYRGELFRDSFAEGAVNGARINIEYENFIVNGIVVAKEKEVPKEDAIATVEKAPIKPPAIERKTKVSNEEKPLDIIAYFTGEGCGRNIHIGQKVSDKELPARTVDQFTQGDLKKIFDL